MKPTIRGFVPLPVVLCESALVFPAAVQADESAPPAPFYIGPRIGPSTVTGFLGVEAQYRHIALGPSYYDDPRIKSHLMCVLDLSQPRLPLGTDKRVLDWTAAVLNREDECRSRARLVFLKKRRGACQPMSMSAAVVGRSSA